MVLFFIAISIILPVMANAQKDKDGAENYSPGSSTTYILNRYAPLASSAAIAATSVTVTNIALLSGSTSFGNSTNPYTTANLAAGDLVMITQIQGADITTTDNAAYGTITAYNNVGNYELRTVLSVVGNTINFCVGLSNAYSVGGRGRAQVVRVPRLNSLTVGTNGIISAFAWDGTVGGICAVEVNGNAVINGRIDATGVGFRGGTDPDGSRTSANGSNVVTLYRTTATDGNTTASSGKGESIVGTIADYASLNGANGRGAPANGGGGGNGRQTGGGGGSNAGNSGVLTPWNGTGIKSTTTAAWANAWNLEAANFATDISRGGGRGGYSRSGSNQNALTVAPGNTAWNDDDRDNVGGFGGRPLDYSTNTRLFFGGGGGAGEGDNNDNGDGGIGGGIVYLLVTGTVSGTGSIRANGNAGGNSTDRDGAGGGGGGGAVIVFSNSTITSISIQANGGIGGDNTRTDSEAHGPGGGGGGGYIFTTTTSVTRTVNGGANGITNSSALTEFLPNGATQGDAGTIVATGVFFQPNDCWKEINGFVSVSCTPGTGSISAANTIINSYYPGTASVISGATRISVGAKHSAGSSSNILPGDLLLVIQMQGSTINSTNTSAYGANTASFNGYLTTVAGTYEYVYAASGVVNNTVYLATPLKNAYTNADATSTDGQYRFQVVKVPSYSTLNIAASASITVAEWNGTSGGIVAADVAGTMTLNGGVAITASNLGFRGGGGRQLSGGSGASSDAVTLSSNNVNASKGEGIAGTPKYTRSLANTLVDNGAEGYPNGSYAQGAPGNAGGGGTDGDIPSNQENTGGGGGANGGAGGRGGAAWNDPIQRGAYGGAIFAQASSTRLVLGGGGGAGTTNDGTGPVGTSGFSSSGGSGGGMIFLKVNAVSGTGTIEANGATGLSVDNDGAGAGGAGGSVYLFSTNTAGLSGVTINARGGGGGSAWASVADAGAVNDGNPEHGPGGGGGGGVIYTNGAINAASSVAGGASGITTTSNLPYFATAGTIGIRVTTATTPIIPVKTYCDIDDDNDGITDVTENPSSVDPFTDTDNDGIPNFSDATSGTVVAWADTNGDGINDNFDADLDGIINELDLDSDNDGIADVIESYGVDANGDGIIDNFVDANNDGLSDNVSTCSQVLLNPSFETPVQPSIGNNLLGTPTFGGWTMQTGGTFNIIKTDGSAYGGGPNNAQNGTQYVDIINAADYFQQNVTVVTSTANVTFGGYFSSREQSGGYVNWTARIELLTAAGVVVATSSTRNFTNADGAEDQIWYYLSGTATLAPGNYFYRVYLGDYGNFDNANFDVCYSSLGASDLDGDGIPNFLDLDSDNDGIPDVVEAGGTDANNDGVIDAFVDIDEDGWSDAIDGDVGNDGVAENTANVLIISGADTNADGRADSWPRRNLDLIGYPNPYDLDSDGDGILDLVEAGFAGTNGIASGTLGSDGWSNTIDALGSLNLLNTDGVGGANYVDIDSDNDGITDNVEAQSTVGYKVPSDVDVDADGINDIYELPAQIGSFGGGGLTPFDFDGDSTPDYIDTDSDNDLAPDRNEGDRNAPFVNITQATINGGADTDGDGLMNVFDNNSITSLIAGEFYKNVTMGNMGPGLGFTDNFDGPTPSGSLIGLQKSNLSNTIDRDWRNLSILPLHIINFSVNHVAPNATIKWDVENELQTNYYEVEYSIDGNNFAAINKLDAKNSNKASYTAVHNTANINSSIFYYRVKQVDKDGKYYYTQTAVIRVSKIQSFTAYPNPFTSFVNCSFSSNINEKGVIEIVSQDGKVVATQSINVLRGNNNIQVNNLGSLAQGNYLLRLITPSNNSTYKLLKN